MSANPTPTLARWTDEEHQILVQLTNDQIELESQDHTQEISWAEHWRKVSVQLQESGYSRTNTACQSYWKRVVETQKANEEAAGPRWDDSEHQILVGMTEDQLALEREDPTAVIPWPKHWKKVSLRLQENGYNRTQNACAAYWLKVGYDFSVDSYEPVPEMSRLQANDDVEVEIRVEVEAERPPKPNQASVDDSASMYSRDEELLPEELPEPKNNLLPNATSIFTPSITPAPSDRDPSEDESYQPRQREPTASKMSQTPINAEPIPAKTRSPKVPLRRSFRFNAEQRAILEAQAAQYGPYPDSDRRYELARELGVDEKTIRNWFIHRRSQKGQSILSGMATPGQNNSEDSIVSDGSTSASGPSGSAKRRPFTMDYKESSLSIGEDIGTHQSKKPRIDESDNGFRDAPRFIPSNAPSNVVTGVEDFGSQGGFGPRQSSGSAASHDPSRNSSMAGSLPSRVSATTSTSSFSPVNLAAGRNDLSGDLGSQMLTQDRPTPQIGTEESRPDIKKSPSFPTPVSGADWNPVNSAKARESNPVDLASGASTPTPTPHTLPFQPSHLVNPHPYGKPVSATPPPNPRPLQQQQQQSSASPAPRLGAGNEADEKQWMSSKVSSFQTEIENLNRDKATRLHRIGLIDRRIDEVTNEENTLEEDKEKEILEAVRQIEERYKGKNEFIKSQQRDLNRSRETELEGLNRNGLDLKKRRAALEHFQALVGLYEEE
ncbi:hypothetical protein BKA65DRAFT_272310 [Rhexocercosporidium sp. MPI-PUGE-AT-0058]|nr:hypothetical protein BKA65DRAFT_272310 [Rhexocercosporidium sp. MPI-PUGE-AT-0058]